MENEKRKSIRIEKSIMVRYKHSLDKDTKWDMTVVKDISERGMSITTGGYFAPNSILVFQLKLPSRPFLWLELKGRIVECQKLSSVRGGSLGDMHTARIEFTDLNEDTRGLIREYIEWFLSKGEGKR